MSYKFKYHFIITDEHHTRTPDLKLALRYAQRGESVQVYYKDTYIGMLVDGGTIATVADFPNDKKYGTVYYCAKDRNYYIDTPDVFCNCEVIL